MSYIFKSACMLSQLFYLYWPVRQYRFSNYNLAVITKHTLESKQCKIIQKVLVIATLCNEPDFRFHKQVSQVVLSTYIFME